MAGHFDLSMNVLKDTIRILKVKFGEEHDELELVYHHLGMVTLHKGKSYSDALKYFDEALSRRKKKHGEENADVAETLHCMGDTHFKYNRHKEAMECYEKAYNIRLLVLGRHHIDLASTLNNMGVIYLEKSETKKAMECFQDALCIRKSVLGEDHEKVANTLHNMGLVHRLVCEYELAMERFMDALRIRQAKLGFKNLKVAETLYNMGIIQAKEDMVANALHWFKEALICYRNLGVDDSNLNVVNVLQWISFLEGKTENEPLPNTL